jgi:SAM-dependent methyltransferase
VTVGWDDARTADAYEAFSRIHDRYRAANEELVARVAIRPGQKVLDVAAGIGGTARAVLSRLGSEGRIICIEPAAAMRERGRNRLHDPRVEWRETTPDETFDRVLVGAAIWQMTPLPETLAALARRVGPGGALGFDIPAAYLGEPDDPGAGDDPMLLALPALLAEGRTLPDMEPTGLPRAEDLPSLLRECGLRPEGFEFRRRMTQAEYRDWLKVPPVSDRLLADLDPEERAAAIDRAFMRVDAGSWRFERWLGFVAWKDG